MLLTLKCLAVAFLTGYLVGIPLFWLLRRGRTLTPGDWLLVPFVGLGVVTLATHHLVYLDVRIPWVAVGVWAATAALWALMGARVGLRQVFRHCPWAVVTATLAVYLVHAAGFLLLGPDLYVGRMHFDRVNYISLAQFLIEMPFSTGWDGIGQRPYLADGLKYKNDRIGVMGLLGFLTVSSGQVASRLFIPTILLGPALVVPGVIRICRALNFGSRESLLAGVAAGLLPGLATLHTCCFLAHTVAVPFLIVTLALVAEAVVRPTGRSVALAILLCAATGSIYTELAILLLAVVAAAAGFGALVGRCPVYQPVLVAAAIIGGALALFPRNEAAAQMGVVGRSTINTSTINPLFWLTPKPLLGATWVCDLAVTNVPDWCLTAVAGLGLVLTCLGAYGLCRAAVRALKAPTRGPNRAAVTALLLVCMAFGPPLLIVEGRYVYQGTKLFLTVAPLLVVGLVAAMRPRQMWDSALPRSPWADVAGAMRPEGGRPLALGVLQTHALPRLVALLGVGTLALVLALCTEYPVGCSDHMVAQDPWNWHLKEALRSTPRDDVVLALGPGMALNSDMSFAARRHRVWLVCPEINDHHALGCANHPTAAPLGVGRHLVDLTTVPPEATVYLLATSRAPIRIEGDKRLLRELGPYQVWRVGPGPYRFVATRYAQRPPDLDHPSPQLKR